jgi:O-antigen/teichoic acid export membrane protein
MPILCFAWFFQAISHSFVHTSFHLAQRPLLLLCHGAITLVVNVVATTILVSRYAFVGAAFALVLSEAFGALFGLALTRFACPLPLVPMKLVRIVLATAAMALVLRLAEARWGLSGVNAMVLEVGAGATIYACLVVLLDIAGMRRAALAVASAVLQRYRDQSTRSKARRSASSLT